MLFRSTEDVFSSLEDNQVLLSTMKASRFVKAFECDVDRWERTLSLIMEVTEMLLTVQRQWMYLEVRLNFNLDCVCCTGHRCIWINYFYVCVLINHHWKYFRLSCRCLSRIFTLSNGVTTYNLR